MERHYKIYDATKEQPKNNEVVLVELDTEIFRFAHYDEKTQKWYPHNTSTPEHNGIACIATVVSWMYLPKKY